MVIKVEIDRFVASAQTLARGATKVFKVTGGTPDQIYAKNQQLVTLGYSVLVKDTTGEVQVTAPR
jgi:hypothetical protein